MKQSRKLKVFPVLAALLMLKCYYLLMSLILLRVNQYPVRGNKPFFGA